MMYRRHSAPSIESCAAARQGGKGRRHFESFLAGETRRRQATDSITNACIASASKKGQDKDSSLAWKTDCEGLPLVECGMYVLEGYTPQRVRMHMNDMTAPSLTNFQLHR
jgi:hypothetical protein